MRMKRYQEPLVHVLIWGSGFLLMVFLVKTIGPFKRADHTLFLPVLLGTLINLTLFYTTSLVLIPGFSKSKKAWQFFILIAGLYFFLTVSETWIDNQFFIYYYSTFRESFHSQLTLNFAMNLIILVSALGYGFTKNWLKSEKLKQTLKQEKLIAELNFLKSQINPHFLFNVLNMAFSSATCSGDEKTADIIEKLSGLMRYMLYDSNVDRVDLEKEVGFLTQYIDLQKMRLASEIPTMVNLEINGSIDHCRIAPLILIPFIENAFKHGISLDKPGEIRIQLTIRNRELEFRVQNSIYLPMTATDKKSSGIGLINVKKRLGLLYPGDHVLNIDRSGGVFSVTLLLNLD